MDPTLAATIIMGLPTVAKPAADVAKDLLVRLLGPSVDIAGDALKQWVEARIERGQETVIRAGTIVGEAGLEIHPVPGRILIPLIQSASLEEDQDLSARWAALLANAATKEYGDTILPAYVEILRQLTTPHVQILDWIFENAEQPSDIEPSISVWRDVEWGEVSYRFGLDAPTYRLIASDLHRLQVIDGRRDVRITYGGSGRSSASTYEVIGLTPLGINFIQACRKPTSRETVR
jgi:CO dehydrogenase/acetyl-CoA synthase gamma subunit (corrinoid Fe-S protein)